jgi:cytochrome c
MNALMTFALLETPRDIPLPLPLPEWLLVFLLVFSFLLHILFVNLMLGGALIGLWAEIKGRTIPEYDKIAREISKTITVNKSMAVVLGVAPLLTINALYTVFFYTANAVTGTYWAMLVPIISVAFLLLYWHKYSWDKYQDRKSFHIGILVSAVVLLLFVPFIFLANTNLMLFPEQWENVEGFFSVVFMQNVFPRYFHFLTASVAVTGLFLFWWMKRDAFDFNEKFKSLDKEETLRQWYKAALYASLFQIFFGPLVLITLPEYGLSWNMVYIITIGASIAITAMVMMWNEIKGIKPIGRNFWKISICLLVTVGFMGTGRHVYRVVALEPHKVQMSLETIRFQEASDKARKEFEAQSNIQTADFAITTELGRLDRTKLNNAFSKEKGIKDLKYLLPKKTIRIKFDGDENSKENLYKMITDKGFKIIK